VKKTVVKIVLDVVMVAALLLLYNSQVLTIGFHEIAGIAILGVFLVHCLLNARWIVKVGAKLFSSTLPAKTRLSYWVTILLVLAFLAIVVSGIFVSKVLFPALAKTGASDLWMTVHIFASAVSLILVGVHVGLYWEFVKKAFARLTKLLKKAARPLAYACLVVVLLFGCYSIATTNFSSWLASPVTGSSAGHGGGASKKAEVASSDKTDTKSKSGEPKESHSGGGSSSGGTISPLNILGVITSYGSIVGVFAIATYYFNKLLGRRRKQTGNYSDNLQLGAQKTSG
jgi:hypothetical protein